MIGFENINWQIFKIGDIMQIENCKCQKVSILKDGDTPYVGATNNNNGVLKFVERKESLLTKGNCIVFICDGEGSIGLSVYKHEDFMVLLPLKSVDALNLIVIMQCLSQRLQIRLEVNIILGTSVTKRILNEKLSCSLLQPKAHLIGSLWKHI